MPPIPSRVDAVLALLADFSSEERAEVMMGLKALNGPRLKLYVPSVVEAGVGVGDDLAEFPSVGELLEMGVTEHMLDDETGELWSEADRIELGDIDPDDDDQDGDGDTVPEPTPLVDPSEAKAEYELV